MPPGARPPSRRPTARPARRTTGPAGRRRATPPRAQRAGTAGGTSRWRRGRPPRPRSPSCGPTFTSTNSRSPSSSARCAGVVGLDELADLLADLVQHAVDRRPVVAQVRGALLHLLARGERGQRAADAVERALRRGIAVGGRPRARPALIRSHWRFTSEAVRASASPNTCGWRRTILDAIAAHTSVMSNTPSSAASCAWRTTWSSRSPSSPGELRRRAGLERVVDLVGLLEEVVAQRLVGLLAVPRAAVRLAEPGRDPGHAPRRGDVRDRRDRPEVQRLRRGPPRSARRRSWRP